MTQTTVPSSSWPGCRPFISLWFLGSAALAAVTMLAAAAPPSAPPSGQPKPPAQSGPSIEPTTVRSTEPSVMDEPLRLITQASKRYEEIADYSCTLIKRERIKGQMQPENVMSMKVRTQPFSVYMKWSEPRTTAGQEVCYVAGKNKGMMRVKPHGLGAVAGFNSIAPDDPRALENSHHTITEAGIGNLIGRTLKGWDLDARIGKTQVHVADYEFNKRPVTRVETVHTDDGNGNFQFYRTIVYFDKEWQLPVRVENFDWPQKGGPKDGEPLEVYSYVDLKLNVGVPDSTFNK